MRVILFVLLISLIKTIGGDQAVYDGNKGQLVNGWENWSWATVDLTSTLNVAPGDKYSVSVVCSNYQAFYVHNNVAFTTTQYNTLTFLINGGSNGGDPINVQFVSTTNSTGKSLSVSQYAGGSIPANKWVKVSMPLSDFGIDGQDLFGFWFLAETSGNCGTIFLDDIELVAAPPAPTTPVTVVVDINSDRRPVSNLIFGANFASAQQLSKNRYTVNRWGGEAVTRYAWDVDAENHASDWFFESIPQDTPNPSQLPFNSTADIFVRDSLSNKAVPIITVPTLGYAPYDRQTRCGFSVKKYGPQNETDKWQPDCGNGIKPDGTFITNNDPADTGREIDENYVLKWLAHLDQVFGKGTVSKFELDNEPGLWNTIHRDVHPKPLTYDELWDKTVQYAGAIKKAYPKSEIYGPIPWGWCEYMFSPADGCSSGKDRQAHGDLPMLEWFIQQVGQYKQKYGVQLVDVIDAHIYPQASDLSFNAKEDPSTAALRFRSTRALWDPTYVDESWINQAIYLIPRIQGWIDKHAPGLKIAISEYNWGDDNIITGALTQVMVLGIFAKQNVYLATRWVAPVSNTRTENAFQLYTNYNGQGASVQGDSVRTTSDNENEVSAYGFYAKGALYVTLVNKIGDEPVDVSINVKSAGTSGKAAIYGFSANENVSYKGSATVNNGIVKITMEPWSAVLVSITF